MFAHAGVGVVQGRCDLRGRQTRQPLQRVQRAQARRSARRLACETCEFGDGRHVLPLVDEPRRGIAHPAVRMPERRGQRRPRCSGQLGHARARRALARHAIDAAHGAARAHVERRHDLCRNGLRVFDDGAVHVDDVEGTVGPGGEVHRTEPDVGRAQELGAGFTRRPDARERNAGVDDLLAVREVVGGLRDDGAAVVLGGQGITAVDEQTAGRREVAARLAAVLDEAAHLARRPPLRAEHAPLLVGTDAEHGRRGTVLGNVDDGARVLDVRVARRVAEFVHGQHHVVGVARHEPPAVVVEAHAELSAAGLDPQALRPRVDGEVASAQVVGLWLARRRDAAAVT